MTKHESPPVKVSHGTSTLAGLGGALALLVPVVADIFSNDTIDTGTRRLLIVCATLLAGLVIVGRIWQAVTAEKIRGWRDAAPALFLPFASHGNGHDADVGTLILVLFVALAAIAFGVAIWLCTRRDWIPAAVCALIGVLILIFGVA
jgi:hypothetical protein